MEDNEFEDVLVGSYVDRGPNISWPPTLSKLEVLEQRLRLHSTPISDAFEAHGGFFGATVSDFIQTPYDSELLLHKPTYASDTVENFRLSFQPGAGVSVTKSRVLTEAPDNYLNFVTSCRGDYVAAVELASHVGHGDHVCLRIFYTRESGPRGGGVILGHRLLAQPQDDSNAMIDRRPTVLIATDLVIIILVRKMVFSVFLSDISAKLRVLESEMQTVDLRYVATIQNHKMPPGMGFFYREADCAEKSQSVVGLIAQIAQNPTVLQVMLISKVTGELLPNGDYNLNIGKLSSRSQYTHQGCSEGILSWTKNKPDETFLQLRSWTSSEIQHACTSRQGGDPIIARIGGFTLVLVGVSNQATLGRTVDALVLCNQMLHKISLRCPMALASRTVYRVWPTSNHPFSLTPRRSSKILVELSAGLGLFYLSLVV